MARSVEDAGSAVSEAFLEPVVRLGVTGLSRSGKTVFITSLVANMLDRARMRQLEPAASGRILSAYLRPQPDDTVPRFPYERHLGAITGTDPHWPDSTRAISELRLSFRVRPHGLMGGLTTLGGLTGPRTVHLDIVDYPGEWLLDLGLMDKSYAQWSETALGRLEHRPGGRSYLDAMAAADPQAPFADEAAETLARLFADSLKASREAGFSDCSPGRFLLPGEMEGSPALTFAPLPPGTGQPRRSLWREFERRYEAYKSKIVKPFFRDHFSRIDRQVVLLDVLGAIHDGPAALEDLRGVMAEVLGAFRPGANSWLSGLLLGRRVEKILFAATKADHLHHSQHAQLTAITEALVREARDRAQFAGARTGAMSLAALRATVEETRQHGGRTLELVRGRRLDTGAEAAFYPGKLPADPLRLLAPAREGAPKWLDEDYQVMRFAPAPLTLAPGEGPPHIRLDRAAQFLFGDRL
ncbi:YcjX family GTP-binding protein [Mangrovicoccus algicola]|uniref:YcjX family protein n=1 Tax=Mangrovicoccus algicola TaxID=2771008 RepID=A0A8J7CL93_9RHOB|nr:YcjX family protein [Mangrovicoccus algicola]MBE3639661.1 YcjX family protein [Mangrovicoccus algicola]